MQFLASITLQPTAANKKMTAQLIFGFLLNGNFIPIYVLGAGFIRTAFLLGSQIE